ncbi:GNAT family N-acetyltransferase [Ekhidna sp.]|uniref:GNAT family N-acetyltransferase n=1 Tax=Ekhidna sp. TaxID=2608089 RepID=UPI003BAC3859
MDLASLKTVDNPNKNQFELSIDGKVAFIAYKVGKTNDLYMVHTEVPDDLEGKGVGHKLVRESLEIIEARNCKIVPLCPFVRSFIQDHGSDYEHLLSERAKL